MITGPAMGWTSIASVAFPVRGEGFRRQLRLHTQKTALHSESGF
jgi:hypothetical protein